MQFVNKTNYYIRHRRYLFVISTYKKPDLCGQSLKSSLKTLKSTKTTAMFSRSYYLPILQNTQMWLVRCQASKRNAFCFRMMGNEIVKVRWKSSWTHGRNTAGCVPAITSSTAPNLWLIAKYPIDTPHTTHYTCSKSDRSFPHFQVQGNPKLQYRLLASKCFTKLKSKLQEAVLRTPIWVLSQG